MGETSLCDDAGDALKFIDNLRDAAPIRPLSVQIVQETHHPEKPEWLALIRQATDTLARGDFESGARTCYRRAVPATRERH